MLCQPGCRVNEVPYALNPFNLQLTNQVNNACGSAQGYCYEQNHSTEGMVSVTFSCLVIHGAYIGTLGLMEWK